MNAARRLPDGFQILLPEKWVMLDLDEATSGDSLAALIDTLARHDDSVARERAQVEALLGAIVREARQNDALMCAVHFDVDSEGRPVQAALTVAIRSVEGSSDPDALYGSLSGDADGINVSDLTLGRALRVSELTDDGFLSLTMLIPAPGVEDRLAVVSLLSPSLGHRDELDEFFDLIANTFTFTWKDEDQEVAAG